MKKLNENNILIKNEAITLKIKEEQLQLAKKWIKTGEVKVYKESSIEEKSYLIPIECEELVIEKKNLSSPTQEYTDNPKEIIRIRLSEEQVEFTKHKVMLEDVTIFKQEIENIKYIEETLKREELKVKIVGNAKVRDESKHDSPYH